MIKPTIPSIFLAFLVCFSAHAIEPGYQPWQGELPGQQVGGQGVSGQQVGEKPSAGAVQSGTGFFVTNTGYIITNEHVVHGCSRVKIRGGVQATNADVVAVDTKYDLALLKTDARPARIAYIRDTEASIYVNDPVLVMGYPLEAGVTGRYVVKKSSIIGLEGPLNEPHWIQFKDAALQGNSGGPLLDSSGNVLGVIRGKTRIVEINRQTGERMNARQADVAIALPVLKEFLHRNNVYFRARQSQAYFALDRVEQQAKSYIVNIHCAAR